VYDPAQAAFVVGWLPKAAAFFTTIEGGEITVTFQGLSVHEYNGFATVSPTPGPQCATYEPGVKTMAYKYSRRTGVLTYKFGNINDQLDPYSESFGFNQAVHYRNMHVAREDAFDHKYYFLTNAPPDMAMLKPVRVTD